jgi:Do/DeqQ family serine protease
VIISNDGYIVTNSHVIEGANEIEVTTNDNQIYTAKLIGSDEATDIALLKIEGKDFPVIPFGDSEALKVGEWVLAIGNPFNLTSTVTAGIVSAKGRGSLFSGYGKNQAQAKIQSFIQTDAAVNPGNSGGALVNTSGELVGINAMIYSETGNFVGYSFAIPVSIVKKVVSDIKQYGVVQRALLGVTIIELPQLKESEPDKYNSLKAKDGVYVNGFSSKSSAEKAGLKEGDVITGINDHKIHNFQELRAQISLYNPGDNIEVQVQRGSDIKTYKVELKNDQGTTEVIKNRKPAEILGASFKEPSEEVQVKYGINYGIEVVNVTNGKFKEAGIKDGFVILTASDASHTSGEIRLKSVDDFEKLVETIMKRDPDERGLYIKGIDTKGKVFYLGIDLNN